MLDTGTETEAQGNIGRECRKTLTYTGTQAQRQRDKANQHHTKTQTHRVRDKGTLRQIGEVLD